MWIFWRLCFFPPASAGLICRCAALPSAMAEHSPERYVLAEKVLKREENTATPSCSLPAEATSDTRDYSGKLRGRARVPKEVNTAIKCPSVCLLGFKEFQTCACTHAGAHTNSCVTLAMNATNTWKTNRLMDGLRAETRQCQIINKGGWSWNHSSMQARFCSPSPLPGLMTTEPSCDLCHRTQRRFSQNSQGLTRQLHHYLFSPRIFPSFRLSQ